MSERMSVKRRATVGRLIADAQISSQSGLEDDLGPPCEASLFLSFAETSKP
jgi:hypothetical protein